MAIQKNTTLLEQKSSILKFFMLFIITAIILFALMTIAIVVPTINHAFDTLSDESNKASVNTYAEQMDRYIKDRELALHDIAATPYISNAVLMGDGNLPAFRDYISHALLLGEDPILTILGVDGTPLFTELSNHVDYSWTSHLLDSDSKKSHALQLIQAAVQTGSKPMLDLAVPIGYGQGHEGILVARLHAIPEDIFGNFIGDAVIYEKNGQRIFWILVCQIWMVLKYSIA